MVRVAALCSANADVCLQRGAGAPGKTVARSNGHKVAVRFFFFLFFFFMDVARASQIRRCAGGCVTRGIY